MPTSFWVLMAILLLALTIINIRVSITDKELDADVRKLSNDLSKRFYQYFTYSKDYRLSVKIKNDSQSIIYVEFNRHNETLRNHMVNSILLRCFKNWEFDKKIFEDISKDFTKINEIPLNHKKKKHQTKIVFESFVYGYPLDENKKKKVIAKH